MPREQFLILWNAWIVPAASFGASEAVTDSPDYQMSNVVPLLGKLSGSAVWPFSSTHLSERLFSIRRHRSLRRSLSARGQTAHSLGTLIGNFSSALCHILIWISDSRSSFDQLNSHRLLGPPFSVECFSSSLWQSRNPPENLETPLLPLRMNSAYKRVTGVFWRWARSRLRLEASAIHWSSSEVWEFEQRFHAFLELKHLVSHRHVFSFQVCGCSVNSMDDSECCKSTSSSLIPLLVLNSSHCSPY